MAVVERRPLLDGLVLDTTETQDGLPPGQGAFLACSFWFVDNLVLQRRHAEPRAMFKDLLLRNDLHLLTEEYDPLARRHRRPSATWRSRTARARGFGQ